MKILSIEKNKLITPKTTGYAAAGGMALSVLSGISKNKNLRRVHKPIGCFSVLAALLHIGLIEYARYKWKHSK